MSKDQRDICGCHKGCTVLEHDCENPCRWPECLSEEESQELAKEITKEL